jgi:hypothetical protein
VRQFADRDRTELADHHPFGQADRIERDQRVAQYVPPVLGVCSDWLMDLNMLVMTGGRERTAGQFAALLKRTRWELERVVPTASPLSVVIASSVGPQALETVAPEHGGETPAASRRELVEDDY